MIRRFYETPRFEGDRANTDLEPMNDAAERDLAQPASISKPILESFQRWLYRKRKTNGQPLSWNSQHLHLKEVRLFFAWLAKQNHLPL